MKNYNKFIFLGLFIIVIVCLTSVSATDSSVMNYTDCIPSNNSYDYQFVNTSSNYQSEDNYSTSNNNITKLRNNSPIEANTTTRIITNDSSLEGNPIYINVSVSSEGKAINFGNATIYIIGSNKTISHTASINNNSFIWTPRNPGIYNITIIYNGGNFGNYTYLKSNSTKYGYIVNPIDLKVDNITVYYTDDAKLTGKISSNGKVLVNHTIIFNVC